jgi:hypothetical protein
VSISLWVSFMTDAVEAEGEDLWNINWGDIELDTTKEIGRGQFGAVYRGSLFGSDVAVKKLLRLDQADAK